MTSPERLFSLFHPPEQVLISERGWISLRLTQIVAIALLLLIGVFTMTVYIGYYISKQAASTAAVVELALMLAGSALSLALGL
ncbi:MAG TPA: hypothetical protein VF808_11005 [Ktedonobacterales bacterium]